MNRKMFALCVSVLFSLFCLPQVRADGRRLVVTTNAPVEIPGKVLSPGVYEFQYYVDSDGPALMRVWARDRTQNYGWFLVEPVERAHATDNAEVDLYEPMAHSPERIREWFFPGEKEGHEFVYRARAKHERRAALHAGEGPIVSILAEGMNLPR
ncbi:MAG TPA: hypothetical protein VNK82_03385 [Terriglobales bacterium]|nr:hypothetical protein [Terriglobales bacterium]